MGPHSHGSAGLCASHGDPDHCSQGPWGLERPPGQPLRGLGRQRKNRTGKRTGHWPPAPPTGEAAGQTHYWAHAVSLTTSIWRSWWLLPFGMK